MRVEQIVTPEGATRFVLLDDRGEIVVPVVRYLKFLDTGVTARNTLRTYCYHLCLFFTFLQERMVAYSDVGIDDVAAFMRWLQYPPRWRIEQPIQDELDTSARRGVAGAVQSRDATRSEFGPPRSQRPMRPARQPRTVNAALTCVLRFYDYLMIHEDYRLQLSDRLK